MAQNDHGAASVTSRQSSKLYYWRELFVAARFGSVGVVATAVHIIIVWGLLSVTIIAPILANTYAFLIAFVISFLGNYLWTFQSPGSPRRALLRFFLIAVCAFAANTIIFALLLNEGLFSEFVSAALSASIVPVISFVASRFWCFSVKQ